MSEPPAARATITGNPPPSVVEVDKIDGRFEPRPWAFASTQAAAIDAHWKQLTAANPALFNGRVLLQHRHAIETQDDGTRLLAGAWLETDFKAFIAWRDFGFPDMSMRNCFAMGALRGSDGTFVLGRMGAHTANSGRIYFPSGTPDLSDVSGACVDLEASVVRELFEETGIANADVALGRGWTIVCDGQRIACMKPLQAPVPAARLAAAIDEHIRRDSAPELAGTYLVAGPADIDDERIPSYVVAYLRHWFAERV